MGSVSVPSGFPNWPQNESERFDCPLSMRLSAITVKSQAVLSLRDLH